MNSKLHIQTKRKETDGSEAEGEPQSPSAKYFSSKAFSVCILGVMEFEIPMDLFVLVPFIKDVFIPMIPRFSSITISDKGKRKWRRVEVNIRNHVKILTFPEGLPVTEYDIHLEEYLMKIGMEPLPEDKPLWEFHAINYPTTKAAGTGIFKVHH